MFDLVISNGLVYYNGGLQTLDLGISRGKIAALGTAGSLPQPKETLDAKRSWILPGFIDSHVHLRYPAQPDYEDLITGTGAAAAGGVTTLVEMPISSPSVYNGDILTQRALLFEKEAFVDFALLAAPGKGLDFDTPSNIASSCEAGAVGYKIFMTPGASRGREDQYKGLCQENDADIYAVFREVAKTGLSCVVHCEDPALLNYFVQAVMRDHPNPPPPFHSQMRPKFLEIYAVKKTLALAEETRVHVHLAHLSTPEAVQVAVETREKGRVNVTCETCPHYLAFDSSALERCGPYAKINPPLREKEDVEGLWILLNKGHIDAVGSDHANFPAQVKEPGWTNILQASAGAPGIEVMGPLILSSVLEGRLSVVRAMEVLALNPARLFGIADRKGEIKIGADADLVLFDPDGKWEVGSDKFFTKLPGGMRLWSGLRFQGKIIGTMVRGQTVYWKGEIVGRLGGGRFVKPTRA